MSERSDLPVGAEPGSQTPLSRRLDRRAEAITTVMAIFLLVLLVQLWLVSIASEEYMAARHGLAIPTFIASGCLFLFNLWLLGYVYDIDREEN
jgi:uncharacterized membrane protein (DUF485 family)